MKTLLSRAALAAAAMALGLSGAAAAGLTATGTLTVKLQINGSCTVASPTVSFPAQTSSDQAVTVVTSTSIGVTCAPTTTPWTLTFGGGNNYSSGSRYMVNGSSQIQYGLYKDPSYLQSIDTGGFVSGSTSSVTVYLQANVPGGAPTGGYQDTIALTLNY
jgi:spore coat protein U domain-containing protein, fimbrial subunit CupE1/2/3/6